MSIVTSFTFNAFQENTFVIYDETLSAVVIDPGCNNVNEQSTFEAFIRNQLLKVEMIINTHCHLDHVLGNRFVYDQFSTDLRIHKGEMVVLQNYLQVAALYGIAAEASPPPSGFLEEGEVVEFGQTSLEVLFTPGHSPASISLYNEKDNYIIGGDVLFKGSIGRTDLPGGDFKTLIESITSKFLSLPDNTIVYPGHGPATTIGEERRNNPFLNS